MSRSWTRTPSSTVATGSSATSARAEWPTSTAPRTRISGGRSRSSSSTGASRRTQEFVERFRREASAAAGLQHPNVVSVYDRGEYDGTYYIAMEFCEGRSLKEVIAREAPLDPQRAIELTKTDPAGRALRPSARRDPPRPEAAQRDHRPRRVGEGVKVADFGIARAGASEITEVGAIMGTAQYLSPEQAQGQAVNEASDLYSIGVVLFEMLTGRPPFEGDSAVAIALKHVNQPAALAARVSPGDPAGARGGGAEGAGEAARGPLHRRRLVHPRPRSGRASARRHPVDSETTARFTPPLAAAAGAALGGGDGSRAPAATPDGLEAERAAGGDRGRATATADAGRADHLPRRACARGDRRRSDTCSCEPEQVEVPLVLGQNARQRAGGARRRRVQGRHRAPRRPGARGHRVPPGPAREREGRQGLVVTLFVSNGPTHREGPGRARPHRGRGRKRLRRAGLRPAVERESSTKVPEGSVIRSDPGPGRRDRARLAGHAFRQHGPGGEDRAGRGRLRPGGRCVATERGGLDASSFARRPRASRRTPSSTRLRRRGSRSTRARP